MNDLNRRVEALISWLCWRCELIIDMDGSRARADSTRAMYPARRVHVARSIHSSPTPRVNYLALIGPFVHSLVHSLRRWCIRPFIGPLVGAFVHSFVHSLIYSSIHSSPPPRVIKLAASSSSERPSSNASPVFVSNASPLLTTRPMSEPCVKKNKKKHVGWLYKYHCTSSR